MIVGRPKLDSERLLVVGERTVNPLGVEPFAEGARDAPRVLGVKQIAPGVRRNRHLKFTRHLPVEEVVAEIEDTDIWHCQSEDWQGN